MLIRWQELVLLCVMFLMVIMEIFLLEFVFFNVILDNILTILLVFVLVSVLEHQNIIMEIQLISTVFKLVQNSYMQIMIPIFVFSLQIVRQIILQMTLQIIVLLFVHILNLLLDRHQQKDVFQLVNKDNMLIILQEDA